jgi:hypothetical protein
MAIALDQALGTNLVDASAGSIVLTTSAAAASGSFIILGVCCFGASGAFLSSVSGGGLTWSIDNQFTNNANRSVAIASAQAPSGSASSTAITATFNGTSAGAQIIGATSFTGVATSPAAPVDGTPTGPTSVGTAAWATDSYAVAAGSIIYAVNYSITLDTTAVNTATGPSVEAWERSQTADNYGSCAEYRIESGAGSVTVAGTWSGAGSTGSANAAVAYLAAATAPDTGLAWIRA